MARGQGHWTGSGNTTSPIYRTGTVHIGSSSTASCTGAFLNIDEGLNINPATNQPSIFFGCNKLLHTDGGLNLFLGYLAGNSSAAPQNMGVGHASGRNLTTGTDNVFLGYLSGENVTSGSFNVFTGSYAGNFLNTGSHNVFTGSYAGNQVTTGTYNLISGSHAGNNLTTGSQNVFLGYTAGVGTIDKYSNVYVGFLAGNTNNEDDNVAVGAEAMLGDKNKNCVFLGKSAGENAVNNDASIYIGKQAGLISQNGNNVFIGFQSGFLSINSNENTFVGTRTGDSLTDGGANTLFGHYAGHRMQSAETGNTFIGHMAAVNYYNPSGKADGRNTAIGVGTIVDNDLENSTAIGQSSRVCTDNTIVIGSNNGTNGNEVVVIGACQAQNGSIGDFEVVGGDIWANGNFYSSDMRLKRDINKIDKPLSTINKLNGYTYFYKGKSETGLSLPKEKQAGVLAQELEEHFPYGVKLGKSEYYSVDYHHLIPLLLEGIKEQTHILESLNERIKSLEANKESHPNRDGAQLRGMLHQNNPNPFNDITYVGYEISVEFIYAQLVIYNLSGKEELAILISEPKGEISIVKGRLNTGIYAYSLIVDGASVDTRTLVISE